MVEIRPCGGAVPGLVPDQACPGGRASNGTPARWAPEVVLRSAQFCAGRARACALRDDSYHRAARATLPARRNADRGRHQLCGRFRGGRLGRDLPFRRRRRPPARRSPSRWTADTSKTPRATPPAIGSCCLSTPTTSPSTSRFRPGSSSLAGRLDHRRSRPDRAGLKRRRAHGARPVDPAAAHGMSRPTSTRSRSGTT